MQPWSPYDSVVVSFPYEVRELFTRFGTVVKVGLAVEGSTPTYWGASERKYGEANRLAIDVLFSEAPTGEDLTFTVTIRPVFESEWSAEDAVLLMVFLHSYMAMDCEIF